MTLLKNRVSALMFIAVVFAGCSPTVDAYQMVWLLDTEENVDELLHQFQEDLQYMADHYSSKNNVYLVEDSGDYFAYVEVPVDDMDDEDLASVWDEEHSLQFFIVDGLGTDNYIPTDLNDSYLVSAEVMLTENYQPYVHISFDEEGALLLEQITEEAIGRHVAIFVNDELITVPLVQQKISGGQAQISGAFTLEEANSLADDLMVKSIQSQIQLIEINEVQVSF